MIEYVHPRNSMDERHVARVLRAIREHSGWSQHELARRATLSQSAVARAERGALTGMRLGTLERIVSALGASLFLDLRLRGGQADRLIDQAHAALVEYVVATMHALAWTVELEYSFNRAGERGSVDILGWHAASRTLLIVEVKSRFTDLQAMLHALARKLRVVPGLVADERGWDALHVGRIVVVAGTAANRSIVDGHRAIFDASFPARARDIRAWLRHPAGPIAGVWFVSTQSVPTLRLLGRQRVRDASRRSI